METKELIKQAREKGITIKSLAEMTDINARTLYNYSCGYRNLSNMNFAVFYTNNSLRS